MLTGPAGIDISRLFSSFDLASRGSVIAAVSGGSDSTALLLLLKDYLDRFVPATRLVAATVDHALRQGSGEEAEGVARLCADLGIAHRVLTWTGRKPDAGVLAAAREARHDLLAQAALVENTDLVLTGHTADDQAETVLMRQARDKGRGLAGIAPATLFDGRIWIARPLLSTRREVLRDFLRRRGVGWIDDPSNVNDAFERPRLRKKLGGAHGEALIAAALNEAGEAAQRREALGEASALLIRTHASRPTPGLIRIDPGLLDADPASGIYALRILLATAGGTPHLPDEARTAALHGRLLAGAPVRVVLARTLVDRRNSGIFLFREARGLPEPAALIDGMVWDGRYRISGEGLWVAPFGSGNVRNIGLPKNVDVPESLMRAALAAEPAIWRDGHSAPHPLPDLLPVRGGRGMAATPTTPSPRSSQGEGKGEGQFLARFDGDTPGLSVSATPLLAPWARFLPSFDLALARAVAALIKAPEIPAPPFQEHISRKA